MFNPDPKCFKDSANIQMIIDKIQISAPWKITKYAEAYLNPIIANDGDKQPMIRILMLIDSGGSLNLISKKLVDTLKLSCKTTYKEFSTIAGKAKATKNTLISFCCKLKDRITLRENDEFISAVPSYTHFLTVKNLPFIVVESPEYMFSIGKMAQRKYKIPIDRTEEFFPTDYQKDQDQPGNNSVINSTIKAKMQTQLLAEERNKQEIFRSGNTLEEMAEPIENNLETLHPRRIVGDISPTSWEETRVGSTASRENEEFCRRMRINESIIDANNFYEVSFHNIIN